MGCLLKCNAFSRQHVSAAATAVAVLQGSNKFNRSKRGQIDLLGTCA